MPCPAGVHEALEVRQQGEITYRRTLKLVRVDTIADLYVARSSGVEIQIEPAAQEVHLSDGAIRLIDQRLDLAVTVAADAPRMGT